MNILYYIFPTLDDIYEMITDIFFYRDRVIWDTFAALASIWRERIDPIFAPLTGDIHKMLFAK